MPQLKRISGMLVCVLASLASPIATAASPPGEGTLLVGAASRSVLPLVDGSHDYLKAALPGRHDATDPGIPTALRARVPNYLAGVSESIRGLRIGVDRRYTQEGIDRQVVAALVQAERTLADLGADIREVHFPPYQKLVSQWIAMCSVETAEAHLDTYPSRKSEYGPDLAQLIEQGRATSGVDIAAIHHERLRFAGSLAAMFEDIHLLLIPTMPVPIPTLTKMSEYGADPNVLLNILRFTAVFDFSGSPTVYAADGHGGRVAHPCDHGQHDQGRPHTTTVCAPKTYHQSCSEPRTPESARRRSTGVEGGDGTQHSSDAVVMGQIVFALGCGGPGRPDRAHVVEERCGQLQPCRGRHRPGVGRPEGR